MSVEPPASTDAAVSHLFRERASQMVACLTHIFGFEHVDLVEDAVQDALVRALKVWPHEGVPANPSAWLIQVAKRRALDIVRRERWWRDREEAITHALRTVPEADPAEDAVFAGEVRDDQLRMVFACSHPALARDAQVVLTLKIVAGLGVGEIARAFLTTTDAVAQKIVRAKRRLRDAGVALELPSAEAIGERADAMLDVIYLTFNEGYSASAGEALVRQDLCAEAIRLGRLVCSHPRVGVPRAHALVALMLLQASRLATRVDAAGDLLLLAEQNRSKWDRALIGLGLHHLRQAAQGHELSSYHLEAEIAACHATAPTYEETDWRRILECYDALCARDPSPVVALNRVVARSNVDGPAPALAALDAIRSHPALATYYPAHATRATLLAALGHRDEATEHFRQAIALTASEPIKRFLQRRIEFLASS